jgi:serine/threonine-protein kinase
LIPLDQSQITGRTKEAVEAYLDSLGLVLDARDGRVAETEEQVGLAYSVSPTGNVREGETIRVDFYSPIPEPEPPAKPGVMTVPSDTAPAGSEVTFTWPTYTGCSAGTTLERFIVLIDENSQFVSGNAQRGPNETSVKIRIPSTPEQVAVVSYSAVCSGMESPVSDPTSVTAE